MDSSNYDALSRRKVQGAREAGEKMHDGYLRTTATELLLPGGGIVRFCWGI